MLTFKEKQETLFERVKSLRNNPTKSELRFKEILDSLGIKYIFQKAFIKDYYCIVDFYLPKPHKIAIEIDGGYHSSPSQIAKDAIKDSYLKSRRFRVLRIKNEDVFSDKIFDIIKANIKA